MLLTVAGLDISPYVRVAHDDGLDPADSDFYEPQFSGTPAFGEGSAGVGEAVSNREMVFPLTLKADSEAELHELIRNINKVLSRGADVEYATSDASETTYFDLEGGRLDVDYQYWIVRSNKVRATLRLWTRPYGHTGTSRVIASWVARGPEEVTLASVQGDVSALGNVEINLGQGLLAYGLHRSPSHQSIWPAGSMIVPGSGASRRGASGAVASQYIYSIGSPTGPDSYLTNTIEHMVPVGDAMAGRHRAFLIAQNGLHPPSKRTFQLQHRLASAGTLIGEGLETHPSAVSISGNDWEVLDMGEVNFLDEAAAQKIVVRISGASGASVVASPNARINALVYLPLDESAGMAYSLEGGAWRVESVPNDRLSAGTQFAGDFTAKLRGLGPRIPPGDSRLTIISGLPNDFVGNASRAIRVEARERFRFLK